MAQMIQAKLDVNSAIRYKPIYPPDLLKFEVPQTSASAQTVREGRDQIANIIHQRDDRLLVIVGPCSLQDPKSALRCATQLHQAAKRFEKDIFIVMRCNIEHPRTADSWKGILNDPHMNGSFKINEGLQLARRLFVDITTMGLPVTTELVGALPSLYLADLVSGGVIGARMAESLQRELASGAEFPVGFTNDSGRDLKTSIDAIDAASTEHHYISATPEGRTAIAWTPGNNDCFVILQGGSLDSDYYEYLVSNVTEQLRMVQKSPVVVIDCSRRDQGIEHQLGSVQKVCKHVAAGERGIVGVTMQSKTRELFILDQQESMRCENVHDECVDWEAILLALEDLAAAICERRGTNYSL